MKSKVALIRCESYDEDIVAAAVKKAVDLVGGISSGTIHCKKINGPFRGQDCIGDFKFDRRAECFVLPF